MAISLTRHLNVELFRWLYHWPPILTFNCSVGGITGLTGSPKAVSEAKDIILEIASDVACQEFEIPQFYRNYITVGFFHKLENALLSESLWIEFVVLVLQIRS